MPVRETEVGAARSLFLGRHANSRYWVDFEDFYRMDVVDIYFVGGFGVMGWGTCPRMSECLGRQPDPLAGSMA